MIIISLVVGLTMQANAAPSTVSKFSRTDLVQSLDLYKGQNPVLLCLFEQPDYPTALYGLLAIYKDPKRGLTVDMPFANGIGNPIRVRSLKKSDREILFLNLRNHSAEKFFVSIQESEPDSPYASSSLLVDVPHHGQFSIQDCVAVSSALRELTCAGYLQ